MTALHVLNVIANHLEGKLPATATSLSNLQYIALFDNNFSVTIPVQDWQRQLDSFLA